MSDRRARAEGDAVLWAECEVALREQAEQRERRAEALAVLALAREILVVRHGEADEAADTLSASLDRMVEARARLLDAAALVERAARLYAAVSP